ncbi:MAG: TetR/AcrR family transcriptional regulator [Myxococcota bacterium]
MGSPAFEQRRTEQRAQVRRAILDATEALLVEEGEGRFSIRRLVERCGYTAPTIYHHFGDKTGLTDALLDERFERLARQLKRVRRGDDPVGYLRAMGLALVRFSLRNPTHHRLLFAPRAQQHAPPRSALEVQETIEQAWTELWEEGRLLCGDAAAAGQAMFCLAYGLASRRIARPEHDWSKTGIEDAIDALLRGLVAPEPAKKPRRRRTSR